MHPHADELMIGLVGTVMIPILLTRSSGQARITRIAFMGAAGDVRLQAWPSMAYSNGSGSIGGSTGRERKRERISLITSSAGTIPGNGAAWRASNRRRNSELTCPWKRGGTPGHSARRRAGTEDHEAHSRHEHRTNCQGGCRMSPSPRLVFHDVFVHGTVIRLQPLGRVWRDPN